MQYYISYNSYQFLVGGCYFSILFGKYPPTTLLKFRCCEKATQFEQIFIFFQITQQHQNKVGDFFQIFVPFSEYLNFTVLPSSLLRLLFMNAVMCFYCHRRKLMIISFIIAVCHKELQQIQNHLSRGEEMEKCGTISQSSILVLSEFKRNLMQIKSDSGPVRTGPSQLAQRHNV